VPDAIESRQGHICNVFFGSKGLSARIREPSVNPCVILCEQGCWLVKSIGNCRKFQKIVKLILLETRFQTLQLLLMKSSLKLNIFESMLNSK
jgi:hypothetical protein